LYEIHNDIVVLFILKVWEG